MIKKLAIKLLLKILDSELPTRTNVNDETQRVMLSRVYQNPAFLIYLDNREETLIHHGFQMFANGKIDDAKGVAGQVFEIQRMRMRLKACYNSKREEK